MNMPIVKKSTSQSVTYEAVGKAEDYSEIITNIDPEMTFYLSNFSDDKKDATAIDFNWFTEGLNPPKKNANPEMTEYKFNKVGSVERRKNNCQFFINSGKVSDVQRTTKNEYSQTDEYVRQAELAMKQHSKDIEYAITTNMEAHLEEIGSPAITGGVQYFLQEENINVTFDNTTNKVVCAVKHGLETGDFVYFKTNGATSASLPTELAPNVPYWIRKDGTTGTDFFIYDDLEASIEDKDKIEFTDNGTGNLVAVKNNIVDTGNTLYTEDHINDVMEMCFKRGGNPTLAVMSGRNKRRFSNVIDGGATKQRGAKDKKVQNVTSEYESDFGTITAKIHPMYGDKRIDVMDMSMWNLKWHKRPQEVPDLAKTGSYKPFVIESWVGLKGTQPKASGSIINIKRK